MKTKQSEAALQQSCVIYFHNAYPLLRGLFFLVHNNANTKREGAFLKAIGLVAGVSDTIFIYNQTCFCIEFKTQTGYQSPAQEEWQEKVENQGVQYVIIKSLDEFKILITKIINDGE